MDDIDRANLQAELILNSEISETKKASQEEIKRTGYCLYCGNKCKIKKQLFCSPECREDYEKEQRIKKTIYI